MSVIYTLGPDELATAHEAGQRRNNKPIQGSADIDSEDAHILGLKGELAFAGHYDLRPDLTINRTGGDAGHDFEPTVKGEQKKVDVKTSTYWHDPWLKVRHDRIHSDVDLYVLAAVDSPRVRLVGWIDHDTIANRPATYETGTTNHICEPDELKPMFNQGEIE